MEVQYATACMAGGWRATLVGSADVDRGKHYFTANVDRDYCLDSNDICTTLNISICGISIKIQRTLLEYHLDLPVGACWKTLCTL